MLAQIASSRVLWVQEDICTVNCALGLSGTLLELSGFKIALTGVLGSGSVLPGSQQF